MHLAPKNEVSQGRLVLLAPPEARIPAGFTSVRTDPNAHAGLLKKMQQFRGKLYLEEQAIFPSDLSADGSHELPVDERSWHLLALNQGGEVSGCVRYVDHPNTVGFYQLGIQSAALARCIEWGMHLRTAVNAEVELARSRGLAYVEVGGWALAPALRHTVEALRLALATFSLSRLLGGCIGITTATERHCSADILRRIGGSPLTLNEIELPPYYDPQYRCQMQILRFDSNKLNPRFEPWVPDLSSYLETAPIIRATPRNRWAATAGHINSDHQNAVRGSWSLEDDLIHAV